MSTGVECPREIVVPLSAEWAEQARELRQKPKDRELQEDVTQSLRMVPDSPRGQGEEAASTRSIVLSSQLEVSCGIMQLEERYVCSVTIYSCTSFHHTQCYYI